MIKILILAIVAYFIFLWVGKLTYSSQKYVLEIEYNGLLWVGLDLWSIWKWDSSDEPIKWIDWKSASM
jgi:hypothetical protein